MELPETSGVSGSDSLRLIPACEGLICFENEQWRPVFLHPSLLILLGISDQDFVRELTSDKPDFLHEEDADSFSLLFYKAAISGGLFRTTVRVRTAGGGYQWTEISLNAELRSGGTIWLGILLSDVNTRIERQQKLDRVYSQLLGVMNSAPGGITAFDTINNRILIPAFVSQGMGKLLRGTEDQLSRAYRSDPYDCIHPEDRGRVIHTVENALRNLTGFRTGMRLRTLDGDYIKVFASATVDSQENHRMLYMAFLDASKDTEDVYMQRQILNMFVRRHYENICLIDGRHGGYRVLTDSRSDGPFLTGSGKDFEKDMEKMIRRCVLPKEQNELIARTRLQSVFSELCQKEDLEYFFTAGGNGQKYRYIRLWLNWLDRETKTIALVSSDVTYEHDRAEETREALSTALLAAEMANEAKSEFLSRMSHDIRTPLNAIIGYIDLSREESICPKAADYLAKAEASSKFLLSLINDILDMSRIESGKLVLKEESFVLSDFLSGISAVIASQCAAKRIQYTCRADGNLHHAYYGDLLKLQQILLNMIGNAVKFTSEDGKIVLSVKEISEGRSVLVRFCVSDTGCGISPEFLPHLFDSFAQERRTLDSEIKGTGLGLAICKSLVEIMHGSIGVESEVGKGSVFTVTLPLRVSNPNEVQEQPAVYPENERDFGGARILLAEDNLMNTEIAKHVLEKVNIKVDTAADGKEACRIFAGSKPGTYKAILMDIRMPVMDGLSATRSIRSMDRSDRDIPVIAMSANAFEEDIREAMSSGMNAYTIKPIDVRQLYATLHRFIRIDARYGGTQ